MGMVPWDWGWITDQHRRLRLRSSSRRKVQLKGALRFAAWSLHPDNRALDVAEANLQDSELHLRALERRLNDFERGLSAWGLRLQE
jgi:hypothetical protein